MSFIPRAKLVALLGVFALPIAASYLAYFLWRPSSAGSYGELLPAAPLPPVALAAADGRPTDLRALQGKWVLLQVDSGRCGPACADKLYLMRQVRAAQGKHMERIVRAWVIDDETTPAADLLREYEGTLLMRGGAGLTRHLPATGDARDHIYLIDPLGNLVLRYPPRPDPSGMVKDLQRLLSVSRIG